MLRPLAAMTFALLLSTSAQAQLRNCSNVHWPECSKSPFAPSGESYGGAYGYDGYVVAPYGAYQGYVAPPYGNYAYGARPYAYYGHGYGHYARPYGYPRGPWGY